MDRFYMAHDIHIDKTLSSIRALAFRANVLVIDDLSVRVETGQEPEVSISADVSEAIEAGFLHLITLAETLGLETLCKTIVETYRRAQSVGLDNAGFFEDHSAWSVWAGPIEQFADAIAAVYGSEPDRVISKSVVEIVRAAQYAIVDLNCFVTLPKSELDVHHRIEAVLRCVFPDIDHKPPIQKAIKNFEPDTGLPAIRNLIEYKFVQTRADVKRVADEILAVTVKPCGGRWRHGNVAAC